MKFFLDNKKKLVIAIVIVELLLLAINVFRFNRSESYLFSQDDFQVDYLNPETNKYERASGAYADHTDKVQSLIFTKPVRLEKGIYNIYVNYSSNADINWHLCYTTLQACLDVSNTKAAHLVYCDKVALPASKTDVSFNSWVRYGTDFEVRMGLKGMKPETASLFWQMKCVSHI